MLFRKQAKLIKATRAVIFLSSLCVAKAAGGFGLKDVYKNLHVNNTKAGSYHDAASGWYSGGSSVIRTKRTSVQPFAMTAPSIRSGCNGIDAFLGSYSMISGGQLVTLANNIGSHAPVYAFHLGLKTYAPMIEQNLKDLRNLIMELNQFGIGHCKITQAAFAAALPQNTAMYETVCNEMAAGGGEDLGGQRKKCRDYAQQKKQVANAQMKDKELLIDNYNLFVTAANKAGIPKELHAPLMSMTGTIIVREGVMTPYPALANDPESWNAHIKGGNTVSEYECTDKEKCLQIKVTRNKIISPENSYSGKAKTKLDELKQTLIDQENDFTANEIGFLNSLGSNFPVFDHITLEAVTGSSILDGTSEVVARSMLLNHLTSVVNDIRRSVITLKQKQMNEKYLNEYEESLQKLLRFAERQWGEVMTDADRINERAEKLEKHHIARSRS